MRGWVATIVLSSVLALALGHRCAADDDSGGPAHVHALLAAKTIAKRRVEPVVVPVAPVGPRFSIAPAPVTVMAADLPTFVSVPPPAPQRAAGGSRAPPRA